MRVQWFVAVLAAIFLSGVVQAAPRKIDDIRTGTWGNRGTCVADVPTSSTMGDGERYRVTDASDSTCTAGGGTTKCTLICQDGAWTKIGAGGGGPGPLTATTTETMLVNIGYVVEIGDVIAVHGGALIVDGKRTGFKMDPWNPMEQAAGIATSASADIDVPVPITVVTAGEVAFNTSSWVLYDKICVTRNDFYYFTTQGEVVPCSHWMASAIVIGFISVIGDSTNGRVMVSIAPIPAGLTLGSVSGQNSHTPASHDYSRGGCATGLGCNDGSLMVIDPGIWDNSPGMRHSTTGEMFKNIESTPTDVNDSMTNGIANANRIATVTSGFAFTNCGTTVGNLKYCTGLTGAFGDEADYMFCRNNVAPWGSCSTGSPCTKLMLNADAPETVLVAHVASGGDDPDRTTPMYVVDYTGCNSSTNTLTIQPFPVATTASDKVTFAVDDTIQLAMNDNVHHGHHYGEYVADAILNQTVTDAFHPRSNLIPNGSLDGSGDCNTLVTSGSPTKTQISYDPTKASGPGATGASSISGSACKLTGTGAGVVNTPQFATVPGVTYGCSMYIRKDAAAASVYRVRNQSAAAVPAVWKARQHGTELWEDVDGGTSATTSTYADFGWSKLLVKFVASEAQTLASIEVDFANTTANYVDEINCSAAPDQGLRFLPVLPDGQHRFMQLGDSRSLRTLLSSKLMNGYWKRRAYLNPFQIVDFGREGSSIITFDTDGTYKTSMFGGFDYAIVWLGLVDYSSYAGIAQTPTVTVGRMLGLAARFQAAGIRVLWIKEGPYAGNSTFSYGDTAKLCITDAGAASSCAVSSETIFRLLKRISN